MENLQEIRAWFERIAPMLPELYNRAYAICVDTEAAEYAIEYALMEGWSGNIRRSAGLRDGLRAAVTRVACDEAFRGRRAQGEWDGLNHAHGNVILSKIAGLDAPTRRLAALRYGCSLDTGRIARLTGQSRAAVREALRNFERRLQHSLPAEERRNFDNRLGRALLRGMGMPADGMPSADAIRRAFEAEAGEARLPARRISRWTGRIALVVLLALATAAFWLMAVLIQPAAPI